jgi:UDP-2,3-diacylglucosamine pyrophosphatase LpxH
VHDAIILSDLHLGSSNCQARSLVDFLDGIRNGAMATRRMILNGDVFDSTNFHRLKKLHWKVLSLIRKLSDQVTIIWINGNHDGPAEIVSHLLGVECRDEIVLESGGRRILVLHGHRFDEFITRYPIVTWAADRMYNLLQRVDQSHSIAKLAKRKSKTFLRCVEKIEADAIQYAARRGCDAVCCGHTHHPLARPFGPVHYFNSGSWTEKPCQYLTLNDGEIELENHRESVGEDSIEPALSECA